MKTLLQSASITLCKYLVCRLDLTSYHSILAAETLRCVCSYICKETSCFRSIFSTLRCCHGLKWSVSSKHHTVTRQNPQKILLSVAITIKLNRSSPFKVAARTDLTVIDAQNRAVIECTLGLLELPEPELTGWPLLVVLITSWSAGRQLLCRNTTPNVTLWGAEGCTRGPQLFPSSSLWSKNKVGPQGGGPL